MMHFRKLVKRWHRWAKLQRKGSFAQSNFLTLITKPLWQQERIRVLMGTPLVAAVIVGATTQIPSTDTLQGWDISQPTTQIVGFQNNIGTPNSYLLPVARLTGISQYFTSGHPGIDLRSPLGSDVVAMEGGIVKEITESKTGYGRHIYIQNDSGRETLYAHLGLIMVETGEKVNAGDKIAEIGLTGWTTGPHLHFEVHEGSDHHAVNPLGFISKAIAAYAETSKIASK